MRGAKMPPPPHQLCCGNTPVWCRLTCNKEKASISQYTSPISLQARSYSSSLYSWWWWFSSSLTYWTPLHMLPMCEQQVRTAASSFLLPNHFSILITFLPTIWNKHGSYIKMETKKPTCTHILTELTCQLQTETCIVTQPQIKLIVGDTYISTQVTAKEV